MISDTSKAKDFVEFLRCVRRENGDKKIVMIVDMQKRIKQRSRSKKLKSWA